MTYELPSMLVQILDERPQKENAEMLGISAAYLCDVQKGRRRISSQMAARLPRIGVTEEYACLIYVEQAKREFAGALEDVRTAAASQKQGGTNG